MPKDKVTKPAPKTEEKPPAPRRQVTSNQSLMKSTLKLANSLTGLPTDVPEGVKLAISQAQLTMLTQVTDPQYVRTRQGRGGKDFRYVDTPYVIERLNLAFGWNWDFEIVDQGEVKADDKIVEVWVKGRLTVRTPMGQVLVKHQFGSMAVEYLGSASAKTNVPVSLGDTFKGAGSDALKKAASMLGLGLDLYDSDGDVARERASFHASTAAEPSGPVVEHKPTVVDPQAELIRQRQVELEAQKARDGEPFDKPAAPDAARLRELAEQAAQDGEATEAEALYQQAEHVERQAAVAEIKAQTPADVARGLAEAGITGSEPAAHKEGDTWQEGALNYKLEKGVRLVDLGGGAFVDAAKHAKINDANYKKVLALFGHEKHLTAHLNKYFEVATIPALTMEQFAGLLAYKRDHKLDPRWFQELIDERTEKERTAQAAGELEKPLCEAYLLKAGDPLLLELVKLDDPFCLAGLYVKKAKAGEPGGGWGWGRGNYDDLAGVIGLVLTGQLEVGTPGFENAVGSVEPVK